MRTVFLAVTPLVLISTFLSAPRAQELPAADEKFEVRNFAVSAPPGTLIKWVPGPDRKHEAEVIKYALNGANNANALILRHPRKRDQDTFGTVDKAGGNPEPGIQWAEFGRLPGEKVLATSADRRSHFTAWLKGNLDEASGGYLPSPGTTWIDRSRLGQQVWEDDARPPRTLFWGQTKVPGYWDLKPGERATYNPKTDTYNGWKDRTDLLCVMLCAMYYHERGIYHASAWGYVINDKGRPELEAALQKLLRSFEILKSTTFDADAGYTFKRADNWTETRSGLTTRLALPARSGGDYRQSGAPRTTIGYQVMAGIDPVGGPEIRGETIEEVTESFCAAFAKTKREKDTMNFITSSSVTKKAKAVTLGDKRQDNQVAVWQLRAEFSWTTLHQTDQPGQLHTVNESKIVHMTVMKTAAGPLMVMTVGLKQDNVASEQMHKTLLESLRCTPDNRPSASD